MEEYTFIDNDGDIIENAAEAGTAMGATNARVYRHQMNWDQLIGISTFMQWRFDGSSEAMVILNNRGFPIDYNSLSNGMYSPYPDDLFEPTMHAKTRYNELAENPNWSSKFILSLYTDMQSGVRVITGLKNDDQLNGFLYAAKLLGFFLPDYGAIFLIYGQEYPLPTIPDEYIEQTQ